MTKPSTWLGILTFVGLLIVAASIAWQWWKDHDGEAIAFLEATLDDLAEEACAAEQTGTYDPRTNRETLLAEALRQHRREDPLAIVHGRRGRRLRECIRCGRHRVRAA